jgi:hypothetical protein
LENPSWHVRYSNRGMNVTVEIPDEIAKRLPPKEAISRELLEAYATEAYRTEKLSRHQVAVLLGLDRWQTEDFLAKRNGLRPFTAADYELELRSQR